MTASPIRRQRHGIQAVRTSVNIPRDLRALLRQESRLQGVSESQIMTNALRPHLEQLRRERGATAPAGTLGIEPTGDGA